MEMAQRALKGGRRVVGMQQDSETLRRQTSLRQTHHPPSHTAPVPSYIRARPEAGYRGERRGYLALADATRPATRPCSSRGSLRRPLRRRHSHAYCALGMSHICITLYTKACYIARGRHDDRPLGAYTCRRLALSQSLPSLPLPILHVPTPRIPVI